MRSECTIARKPSRPTCPHPPHHPSLTGVVERIIFLNEENHYTIAEFRPDGSDGGQAGARDDRGGAARGRVRRDAPPDRRMDPPLAARGPVQDRRVQERAARERLRHPQVPRQRPGARHRPVYANKIVDAFGTDTFRVLSEESGRLRDVPGIGRKRAAAIKQAWDGKRTERELYIFLQTYGVSPGQCVKLVKQYGGEGQGGPDLRALPGGARDRGDRVQDGRPDRDQPRVRQRRAAEARRGGPLRDGDAPGGGAHRLSPRRGSGIMPPRC
jgi:hypothetical protein